MCVCVGGGGGGGGEGGGIWLGRQAKGERLYQSIEWL